MANVNDQRFFLYRIDGDNKITCVNREWVDFASENDAPELTPENVVGRDLHEFISGWPTQHLYEIIYQEVRQSGREIRIPFRCDSPEKKRSFRMRVTPLEQGGIEFSVNVIEIESCSHRPILERSVRHSNDFLVICSWCKRIKVDNGRWAEIEEAAQELDFFGATPPSLTHEICQDCYLNVLRQFRG